MNRKKINFHDLRNKKKSGEKIVRVVCYDFPTALLADRAGVDSILVGDSLAMVSLGMKTTLPLTMDEMITHCKAVARAVETALVVGDLPFLSYQVSIRDAIFNAGRLMKEGNVDAVKLEGGVEVAPTIKAIVNAGIPVTGHIGLTPQSVSKFGGYKVQGKDIASSKKLLDDAKSIQQAGALMISLECVPDRLAQVITKNLDIPVIGIGSGPHTDGQSLVLYDMIGLFDRYLPKFVKRYANCGEIVLDAIAQFKKDVIEGSFPEPRHCFSIEDKVMEKVLAYVEK